MLVEEAEATGSGDESKLVPELVGLFAVSERLNTKSEKMFAVHSKIPVLANMHKAL
jgi:hypothetical protein